MPTGTKTPPAITVDGNLSEWTADQLIQTPANTVPGYNLYGTVEDGTYYLAIQATSATDPVIGAGTTIWLNTDQNNATGLSGIGADYDISYINNSFYLYNVTTGDLVSTTPLTAALSADGKSLEVALPATLITPAGGTAPAAINLDAQIDTTTYLPTYYSYPEYTITDPASLQAVAPTHRVAIVYSDTSAALYFNQTAYSDLFMAAQNQARMAGVSYDVIDESKLTNINNLLGYDALIFPSMPDVNTAQLPAIMQTLQSAVYNYHIGIITAGDFLTNDQTGAPLAGNSYANMQALLNLSRYDGGNSGNVTVTANDVSNPIMKGYTAGQVIHTYANEGYAAYEGVTSPADVLVNQNVTPAGSTTATTLPGVVQTTTGGTNVHFATTDLLGDSNLLSNAIQSVVLGTQPGVALHLSRDSGVVAARMDMDQSQFPEDVSPSNGGPGIYDELVPILQQWKQTYNFVGTYFINVGDNPTPAAGTEGPADTDWTKSLAYYQQILAMGGEIGTHSYTHLINPPTTSVNETTTSDTPAGSTQITLSALPSYYGITVGMAVSGSPFLASNAVIAAVSGNTITITAGLAEAVTGDIPAGTSLTFKVSAENTNFLQTNSAILSADGHPFTYDYEFNQSKLLEAQRIGTTIYGAAIPGANETYATDKNILPYFQSVAPTATTPGYTGYLTGGWTGIGSGYPSAFGYLDPTQQNSVYLAPNMTFDFTDIGYLGKTIAEAEADWTAQFNAINANAAGTPIVVWPIHDYGAADWNTTTDSPGDPSYSTQLYTDFIAQAYAANYEFVTMEDLASRIAAQQKAHINYTTSGNTITATVTPDPTAPDLGAMALSVINGGTQVIQSVTNWYAYNGSELFLPDNGGTFTINLGPTQDAVTHIASLPMRADLLSVTGDGTNLTFSVTGSGQVVVDLKQSLTPVVTGATVVSQNGNVLTLALSGSGQQVVTITLPAPPTEVVSAVAFSADSGASTTDFITNVAAQTISGTLSAPLAAGNVVKVSLDNGTTWLSATAATGATTFTLAGVTLTGSNTLIAEVQNAAGVASTPLTQAYVLDQVPPTETATVVSMTDDSGVAGDFITNNGAAGRVVSGTLSAALAAGETLKVSMDGGATWAAATVTGTNWTATDSTSHTTSWMIEAEAVDLAGNVGAVASKAVTFDNTPPAAPGTPALDATSDSGVSNSDGITNVNKPLLDGTGEAGATISLYDGTTLIGTGVASSTGAWSVASTTLLADGVHSITATQTDVAGNTGPASAALSITIDTVAPAAPSKAKLDVASDTGAVGDNITSVTTPIFDGTAPANTLVTLYDGTNAIGTGTSSSTGAWSITSAPLAAGAHSITAKTSDVAGNYSAASVALTVTIETSVAAPSTPALTAATDKGASNKDGITDDKLPVFTGTAPTSSKVTLYNGTTVVGTATANATTGKWTITTLTAFPDGTYAITATATDKAGNVSAPSAAMALVIDTVAPSAPAKPTLAAASDSGVLGDNITNASGPTFTGSAEAGSTVTLYSGATKIGTGVAGADGSWSVTSTKALANGTQNITATATDVAGNVSLASAALSITIDTKAPARPARATLASGSDSGISTTDGITNVAVPTFTGTAEAASTVTVLDGTTIIGTGVATATGTWTIASTTKLGDGKHSITVKATDTAGNVSAASAAEVVTIDTSSPAAPTFSSGTLTSLSGKGEAGGTVTLADGTTTVATATVGSGGNWSMSFIGGTSVRTLNATETDKAGNVGAKSGAVILGTIGNDTLVSTPGNDLLIGGAGADTYSFASLFGNDTIAGFAAAGAAHDIINFKGSSVLNSYANVMSHTTQVGTGAVISLDANDTVTLLNVNKTSLTAANFTFA